MKILDERDTQKQKKKSKTKNDRKEQGGGRQKL